MASDKERVIPKLSKDPITSKDVVPKYPYMSGSASYFSHEVCYQNPEEYSKSYYEKLTITAGYQTSEVLEEEGGLNKSFDFHERSYNKKGVHKYTESHMTDGSKGHNASVSFGERGTQTAKNHLSGIGQSKIEVAHSSYNNYSATGSLNNAYGSGSGDGSTLVETNQFTYYQADHADTVAGSKYSIVNQGEYGIHVQQGNMDTRVEKGKLQIYSGDKMIVNTASTMDTKSAQDMTITSQTKILLTVGSSYILIEPSKITIKSPVVEIIQG